MLLHKAITEHTPPIALLTNLADSNAGLFPAHDQVCLMLARHIGFEYEPLASVLWFRPLEHEFLWQTADGNAVLNFDLECLRDRVSRDSYDHQ